jgi:hypothetical protein
MHVGSSLAIFVGRVDNGSSELSDRWNWSAAERGDLEGGLEGVAGL